MSKNHKYLFSEGEKVLCYEPDPNKAKVLYDSKILECCVKKDSRGKKTCEYLVHFFGWNSSWDRLMNEQSILKDNPENRQLQRHLAEIAAEPLKGKKLKLNKIPAIIKEVVFGNSSTTSSHNKSDSENKDFSENENDKDDSSTNPTNRSELMEGSEEFPQFQPSSLRLPDELRSILDEDHEKVFLKQIHHNLPANFTVKRILEKYYDCRSSDFIGPDFSMITRSRAHSVKHGAKNVVKEFIASLEMYFNCIIETHLLYNFLEENQLKELKEFHPNTPFSEMYGINHLVRLLQVLPEFLAATPGMSKNLETICKLYNDLTHYLSKNKNSFKS